LRYAKVDEDDLHGGSVTLNGDGNLRNLKDGQFLKVVGHFNNPDDKGTASTYHVDSFEVFEPAR
jgi:hypothetical protein